LELFQRLLSLSFCDETLDGPTKLSIGREETRERRVSRRRRMQAEPREDTGNERINPSRGARQLKDLHQTGAHAGARPIAGEQSRRCITCDGDRWEHKNGERSVSRRLVGREQYCALAQ
jgi:hypothetical protein